MTNAVRVGIVLGSDSDLEVMLETVKVLDALAHSSTLRGVRCAASGSSSLPRVAPRRFRVSSPPSPRYR